jgi:hypothetical protein
MTIRDGLKQPFAVCEVLDSQLLYDQELPRRYPAELVPEQGLLVHQHLWASHRDQLQPANPAMGL